MAAEHDTKEKLFNLLESYFMSAEESSEVNELSDSFDIARASDTHESYVHLLEKLRSSSKDFPGFNIKSLPTSHGRVLMVTFPDTNKNKKETLENGILRKELMEMKSDILCNKSSIHDNKHDAEKFEIRCNLFLSEVNMDRKKDDDTERNLISKNTKDSFTFLMVNPLSSSGFLALLVFFVQITSFCLTVSDLSSCILAFWLLLW